MECYACLGRFDATECRPEMFPCGHSLCLECLQQLPSRKCLLDNTLATLPDDVLLQVLSFLTPRQLFKCRMVCRRLRDLAAHPVVWREKRLEVTTVDCCRLAAAALCVAPCLRNLTVWEPLLEVPGSHWRRVGEGTTHVGRLGTLLASTRCAVAELDLLISPIDAVLVAVVIARQAALGRLKELRLSASAHPDNNESSLYCLKQLLEEILFTPGLQTVELDIHVDAAAFLTSPALLDASEHEAPVPAALRELLYLTEFRDPGFPLQLGWHRATLEVLKVMTAPPDLALQLPGLPRLRDLTCPLMPGMLALLQCPSLRSLHLIVPFDDAASAPYLWDAASFLRQAVARLESAVLEFVEGEYRPEALALVPALGDSGSVVPALRSLTIKYTDVDGREPQDTVRPLAAVLPRMEHLVSLHIGGVLTGAWPDTDTVLDLNLLDGKVLPCLQKLSFVWREDCPHHWAHSDEPRLLMRRYPRLHVDINSYHDSSEDDFLLEEGISSGCEYCKENKCHDFDNAWITLFSHPPGAACGVMHQARDARISLD